MPSRLIRLSLVLVLALTVSAPARAQTLFDELGGLEGLERITSALIDRLYADPRIAFLFEDTQREDLQQRIVEQFCEKTGGPCTYTGRSMVDAHSGLEIRHNEFDAFVEDFILGMEDAGVPYTLQNRMLAIFAPMREDVVYR